MAALSDCRDLDNEVNSQSTLSRD